MLRIVKTLYLKPDPESIARYREIHENIWPEIRQGIKDAGIHNMELFLLGNLAVMTVEIEDGLNPESVFDKLASLPRQQEWENFVARFQQCGKDDSSAQKWHDMERIFSLTHENC